MDPINYSSLLTKLDFSGLQNGLQNRQQNKREQQIADARTAQAGIVATEAQRAESERLAYRSGVEGVLADPSAEGFAALALRFPEQTAAIKTAADQQLAGVKTRNINAAMDVLGLINAGAIPAAISRLKTRRTALQEAKESTEITDTIIADLESGDAARITRAKGTAAFALYPMLGDQASDVFKTLGLGAAQQQDAKVLGYGQRLVDGTGNVLYEAPDAPFTLGEGQTRYSNGGGAGGGSGGSGAPRGVRNNNVGNLKDGPFARSQPGYAGSDGTFARFDTPAAGAAAQTTLLRNKYVSRGIDTPTKIVERYAPASENSAASRRNYAKYIADGLGIASGDTIAPAQVPQLQRLMADFENGTHSGGGARAVAAQPKPTKEAAQAQPRSGKIKVGAQMNGFTFLGGNPADQSNWRRN